MGGSSDALKNRIKILIYFIVINVIVKLYFTNMPLLIEKFNLFNCSQYINKNNIDFQTKIKLISTIIMWFSLYLAFFIVITSLHRMIINKPKVPN